ncbi:MAG: hydroxymethylbilane synthase [Acidobacteriota bacterium]
MADLVLRLGTRQSPLALAQSRWVAREIESRHAGVGVELVPIITRGDREKGDLGAIGGKGLFTEELEQGLLDGSMDLAVHSLKDLPVTLPEGLAVVAYPERADPRDGLICEVAEDLDGLPEGAVLLTGSQRRQAQLLHQRSDLRIEPVRGNVGTRLRKWRDSGHAGAILAVAGIHRLGLDDVPLHPLDPERIVPAPGQGILAVEVRLGGRAEPYARSLDHPPSAQAAAAERRIVTALGGDCTLPLAAWARPNGNGLRLTAVLAAPDGQRVSRGEGQGASAEDAAEACLEALRRDGSESLLATLRP